MLRRDLFKYLTALFTTTLIVPETSLGARDDILSITIKSTFELEQIFTTGLVAYEEPKPKLFITTVSIEYKNGSIYEFVGNSITWILNKEISKEFYITDIELFDSGVVLYTNNGKCVIENLQ